MSIPTQDYVVSIPIDQLMPFLFITDGFNEYIGLVYRYERNERLVYYIYLHESELSMLMLAVKDVRCIGIDQRRYIGPCGWEYDEKIAQKIGTEQ